MRGHIYVTMYLHSVSHCKRDKRELLCFCFTCSNIRAFIVYVLIAGLRDRGYGGYGGGNRGAQEMSQLPPKSSNGAYSRAAAEAPLYDKDQYDDRRHLS